MKCMDLSSLYLSVSRQKENVRIGRISGHRGIEETALHDLLLLANRYLVQKEERCIIVLHRLKIRNPRFIPLLNFCRQNI